MLGVEPLFRNAPHVYICRFFSSFCDTCNFQLRLFICLTMEMTLFTVVLIFRHPVKHLIGSWTSFNKELTWQNWWSLQTKASRCIMAIGWVNREVWLFCPNTEQRKTQPGYSLAFVQIHKTYHWCSRSTIIYFLRFALFENILPRLYFCFMLDLDILSDWVSTDQKPAGCS